MLRASLGILYRGNDAVGTVLVGTLLTGLSAVALLVWVGLLAVSLPVGVVVTPVLLLPGLLVRGYLLRVAATGVAMRPAAPSFVRWGSLVRGGLRSTALAAGYLAPVVALGVVSAGAFAVSAASAAEGRGSLVVPATLLGLLGVLGVLCVGALTLYVWPAAHAVLAATGSLRASANPLRAARLAVSIEYATGWLLAGGILVVGPSLLVPVVVLGALIGLLNPIVAFVWLLACLLLAVSLWFAVRTSAAWAVGRGAAIGLGTLAASSTAPSPAAAESPTAVAVGDADTAPSVARTNSAGRSAVPPALQVGRSVDSTAEASSPVGAGTCRLYPPLTLPAATDSSALPTTMRDVPGSTDGDTPVDERGSGVTPEEGARDDGSTAASR